MLNVVKHLNTFLIANRFLTSFEMTGKKEGGRRFADSLEEGENDAAPEKVSVKV